jgi:GNAT superfamily N-acetyltransferase
MLTFQQRQQQLESALKQVTLPPGIQIQCWKETDFSAIQRLSVIEGWPTPIRRPDEALKAWQQSWPTLVIIQDGKIIGFLRGLTDGEVTTYVAELLINADHRGKGLGTLLLEVCHALHPHARLDLISTEAADLFYEKKGFRYVGKGQRRSYR